MKPIRSNPDRLFLCFLMSTRGYSKIEIKSVKDVSVLFTEVYIANSFWPYQVSGANSSSFGYGTDVLKKKFSFFS